MVFSQGKIGNSLENRRHDLNAPFKVFFMLKMSSMKVFQIFFCLNDFRFQSTYLHLNLKKKKCFVHPILRKKKKKDILFTQ